VAGPGQLARRPEKGLRGAVEPDAGLFRRTALEVKAAMHDAGVAPSRWAWT
jgi:hypothetical protein